MGYYRSLYVGPALKLSKPNEPEIAHYTYFDQVSEKFDREDTFAILQRHVGGCKRGETWVCANAKGIGSAKEISTDPVFCLSNIDIEGEKTALVEKYAKEIAILEQYYGQVEVDWVIVVDGA